MHFQTKFRLKYICTDNAHLLLFYYLGMPTGDKLATPAPANRRLNFGRRQDAQALAYDGGNRRCHGPLPAAPPATAAAYRKGKTKAPKKS
jgi:hypothetical protein